MTVKYITVKGPDRLARAPFYVGIPQHERTMSKREAYEHVAKATGYTPTSVKAVFMAAAKYANENQGKGNITSIDGVASLRTSMGGPRTHERSSIPNWRQKDAAALLGISTRQLRSYKTRPPDSDWPGWKDPVKLKIWLNARNGGARMAQAIKNHLPLREGGVTERGMVGSRLPPRQFRQ